MAKQRKAPFKSGEITYAQHNPRQDDPAVTTIFYMLFPLLLFAPFFRGLFFDEELLIAHMYTALVAGLYFYKNPDKIRFSKNIMDYAAVGLIIGYMLSTFVALVPRDAVGEILKVLNYFLVYWLVAHTARNLSQMKKVMTALYLAGCGVAFIGIGAAFGTFAVDNFSSKFLQMYLNGAYVGGMINSTIQYHNAAAIYLVAAGMVGLYLSFKLDNIWARILIAGGNYLIFMTALGAGSRGAMLVTPVALLLQFAGLPRRDKEEFFYSGLSLLIPFVVTAKGVLSFDQKSEGYYWGMLVLGFVIACAIKFAFEKFTLLSGKIKRNYLLTAGAVVTVLVLGILVFKGSEVMPVTIAERAKAINLKEDNVIERFYFYKDAMKVVKEHPVLGVGGGGWNSVYRSYQSYLYHTTEVHNHFLQTWVEGGIIGFSSFIILWIGLLATGIKILLRAQSDEMKTLTWSALAAAAALGMHSAIDFTLSLGAPMILMFALFGLVRGGDRQSFSRDSNYYLGISIDPWFKKVAGIAIMAMFLLVSGSFRIAANKSQEAYNTYNYSIDEAIAGMESATKFDPLNHTYHLTLAQMYGMKAYQEKDMSLANKAIDAAKKAVELNMEDSQVHFLMAQVYMNAGQWENAIAEVESALVRAPMRMESYQGLAQVYNASAQGAMSTGDRGSAKKYSEQVIKIPQRMNERASTINDEGRRLSKGPVIGQVTQDLQAELDKAKAMLSQL